MGGSAKPADDRQKPLRQLRLKFPERDASGRDFVEVWPVLKEEALLELADWIVSKGGSLKCPFRPWLALWHTVLSQFLAHAS